MEQLLRVAAPAEWREYHVLTATTPASVASGVDRLAALFHRHGERALWGEPLFFAEVRELKRQWTAAFALDALASQIRPVAEAAFREGRYREAAELYEKIAARLSAAEKAKLAAARKRS